MRAFARRFFWATLIILALGAAPVAAHCFDLSIKLKRGDFPFKHFEFRLDNKAQVKTPKALIVFISGAGGWTAWEDRISDYLQSEGYEIVGVNAAKYATIDYQLDELESDFETFAQFGLQPYGNHAPPLIFGGWSTGAEQSVAIAGGPHPPGGLVGLLLISPGACGGYGTDAIDYLEMSIPASKKFALADFAPRLDRLRIAQWHAGLDVLDSRAWLATLKAPHREYDFPNVIHDYWSGCEEFLEGLNHSLDWILESTPTASPVD